MCAYQLCEGTGVRNGRIIAPRAALAHFMMTVLSVLANLRFTVRFVRGLLNLFWVLSAYLLFSVRAVYLFGCFFGGHTSLFFKTFRIAFTLCILIWGFLLKLNIFEVS